MKFGVSEISKKKMLIKNAVFLDVKLEFFATTKYCFTFFNAFVNTVLLFICAPYVWKAKGRNGDKKQLVFFPPPHS